MRAWRTAGLTKRLVLLLGPCLVAVLCPALRGQTRDTPDGEIIANLAGGRVIVQVTKDNIIVFGAIDQPIEKGSVQPRVMDLDGSHVGILLGASEWRYPADPKPVRLDRSYQRIGARDPHAASDPTGAEPDLETIGVGFLEELRPLVSQLHQKIEMKPDEPLFELVIIGFAPRDYGPEVWTVEYRVQQQQVGVRSEYWQTRILRPRFEQIYPPEKHAPRTIVETRYPPDLPGPTVMDLIQNNDPRIAKLRGSDPRFEKVLEDITKGQAQKAASADSADFLRALLPLVAGDKPFILATMEREHGMNWIVTPSEPVEKAKADKEDKDRPPEAPSLRRRPEQ